MLARMLASDTERCGSAGGVVLALEYVYVQTQPGVLVRSELDCKALNVGDGNVSAVSS
jgi:hypothetical protein